jgi:HrpA-like RNA helicase
VRKDLRVVLMSATVNAALFCNYFGNCPAIHVPGLAYPVTTLFLEDAIEATSYYVRDGDRYSKFHKNGRPRVSGSMERDKDAELMALARESTDVVISPAASAAGAGASAAGEFEI